MLMWCTMESGPPCGLGIKESNFTQILIFCDTTLTHAYSVFCCFWSDPAGQVVGCLDQQKLSILISDTANKRERERDCCLDVQRRDSETRRDGDS